MKFISYQALRKVLDLLQNPALLIFSIIITNIFMDITGNFREGNKVFMGFLFEQYANELTQFTTKYL
jgi:hypothetical protein